MLYIRLKETYDPPLGKLGLEALTKCPVINYVRVTGTAYKTKVHIKTIMENSRVGQYFVDTWKSRSAAPTPTHTYPHSTELVSTDANKTLSLKITSWNCRALPSSIPYLNSLISEGSDIIVISEHWLWLFELHRLSDIHPDFHGHGQADSRLTSCSIGRGFGGVGIIWQCDLDATVVHATTSDRICSIRLTHQS